MSPRAAARLAWMLCAVTWLAALGTLLLTLAGASEQGTAGPDLLACVVTLTFVTVGALVVSWHPRNPEGWILCAAGITQTVDFFATQYAIYALVTDPGSLPGGVAALWLAGWVWAPSMLSATLLLLLFPDGRLPSPRWRPVAWLAVAGILGAALYAAFLPGPMEHVARDNPLGLGGVGGDLAQALVVSFALIFVASFASISSLVVRLRRARGDERQQLKWLASGGAVLAAGALISYIPGADQLVTIYVGQMAVAVAVGVGILKYRLYDIDVVINRTLVYGSLTATLAGAYLGAVLLLQIALSPLTASNSLAIAVSTLAVAALFQRARRCIQAIVDRRFYRRKYDAARMLERFGAQLRDEVDLDALGDDLRTVVAQTMQPAHVTLWLRAPEAGR